MAKARSFFHDVVAVFGTKIVVLVLSLAGIVVLSRSLGAEGQGILATLLVVPLLMMNFFDGGMRQSATYYLGKKLASDEDVLGAVLLYAVMAGVVGFCVAYAILHFQGSSIENGAIYFVVAAILPAGITVSAVRGFLLGKQQIKRFNAALWFEKALYVAMLCLLWLTGHLTVFTAAIVSATSAGFNALQALWFLLKSVNTRPNFSFMMVFRMLKIGAVYALAMFLIMANYKLDIVLMGMLSTDAETGKYAIAARIGEMLWELPAAVGMMIFARSANSPTGSTDWEATACRAIRLSLWVTIAGAVAFGAVAPFMVPLLFGADFKGADTMLLWLLPGMVMMVVFKLANTDLGGKGKPYIALAIMSIAVPVNIGLNYLLIPDMGGVGAALASTASYTLSALIMIMIYSRRIKRPPGEFLLLRKTDLKDAWAQGRKILGMEKVDQAKA